MADWKKAAGAVSDVSKGISQATGAATGNTVKYEYQNIGEDKQTSDANLKDFSPYGEKFSEAIENINAYLYTYKPEAQQAYGVDDKDHVGVMAQELQQNPVTVNAVEQAEDGHLEVNIKELTMENTALIADLARRVKALELAIGGQ